MIRYSYFIYAATALFLTASLSHAGSSVVFSRDTITIESSITRPISPPPNNAQSDVPTDIPTVETIPISHELFVTIRNASMAEADWIIDNSETYKNYGVLYIFDTPSLTSIPPSDSNSAQDILFIGSYGDIKTIAKNITPAHLAEPIAVDIPVKALLYVEPNYADNLGITPGNRVLHALFPNKPNVVGQ